jgi:2-amino-4-hydroxy-6-hydroxymethyldihydropteridine diphosphokinase
MTRRPGRSHHPAWSAFAWPFASRTSGCPGPSRMPKSSSNARVVPDVAYVALGSNLGDRHALLARARDAVAALPGVRVLGMTAVEETAPLGGAAQPPYLNQMMAIETGDSPPTLLAALHDIEARLGRVRGERWASRTIDLDLVFMERQASEDPTCTVPHPGLPDRDFWRRELAELRARVLA